jgi:hypothetical protein
VTHILCRRCGGWQGNVGADGPIGWLAFTDHNGQLVGWMWDHDCRDGRVRHVIQVDEVPSFH